MESLGTCCFISCKNLIFLAIVMVIICFSNIIEKRGSDAMRIKPEFVDNDGKVFWKLKSYNDESSVLLQGNSQNPVEMMILL